MRAFARRRSRSLAVSLVVGLTAAAAPAAAEPIVLQHVAVSVHTATGIDYHEPTKSIVTSVNSPTGLPYNLQRIEADGSRAQYTALAGLTDEVRLGAARRARPSAASRPGSSSSATGSTENLRASAPTERPSSTGG